MIRPSFALVSSVLVMVMNLPVPPFEADIAMSFGGGFHGGVPSVARGIRGARTAESRPRLTKEQHEILEKHFQGQNKPNTATKRGIAESLGVPLEKINNWFQNRRAKVKHEIKKQNGLFSAAPADSPTAFMGPSINSPTDGDYEHRLCATAKTIMPSSSPLDEPPSDTLVNLNAGPQRPVAQSAFDYPVASVQDTVIPSFVGGSCPMDSITNGAFDVTLRTHELDRQAFDQAFNSGMSCNSTYALVPPYGFGNHSAGPGEAGFEYDPRTEAIRACLGVSRIGDSFVSNSTVCSASRPLVGYGSPVSANEALFASTLPGWVSNRDTPLNVSTILQPSEISRTQTQEPSLKQMETQLEPTQNRFARSGSDPAFLISMHDSSTSPPVRQPEVKELRPLPHSAFSRRNSMTSALADSVGSVQLQAPPHVISGFKQPRKQTNIAARRRRPAPSALGPAALMNTPDQTSMIPPALRSASHNGSVPLSPTAAPSLISDHCLRRIRSSGFAQGRIQKVNISGSAQRSPLPLSYSDASSSPGLANFNGQQTSAASSAGITVSTPASVAPLTPHSIHENHLLALRQNGLSSELFSRTECNSKFDLQSPRFSFAEATSPPTSPMHFVSNFHRITAPQPTVHPFHNQPLGSPYRPTPPLSAPATQQSFHMSSIAQRSDGRLSDGLGNVAFANAAALTNETSSMPFFRRPSLPEAVCWQGPLIHNLPESSSNTDGESEQSWALTQGMHELGIPLPCQHQQRIEEERQPLEISRSAIFAQSEIGAPHMAVSSSPNEPVPAELTDHHYASSAELQAHQQSQFKLSDVGGPISKSYVFANHGPNDFLQS